jgi:hypothetical protein
VTGWPSDHDYIVIRDPDHPKSGTWYDLNELRSQIPAQSAARAGAEFAPTPFIEIRADGAVAQVWMRRRSP